jgi:type III pantothenate kinase
MLLAVDVGNTNVVVGLFDGERLDHSWRLETDAARTADEYAALLQTLLEHAGHGFNQISGVAISSGVPPLTTTFGDLSRRYFGLSPLVVSADIETGIRIAIDNPREMGADRIVNALAALRIHGVPAIVIDFGTATTFDPVSANGELLGTAIAPGLQTSMEGLYRRAAKLFSVELVPPGTAIGRNTVAALQSGAIYGYVGLVEGLVARIKREMGGQPLVIATGGLAPLIVNSTDVVDVTDLDLTLHGLRLIHELNVLPSVPEASSGAEQDRIGAAVSTGTRGGEACRGSRGYGA